MRLDSSTERCRGTKLTNPAITHILRLFLPDGNRRSYRLQQNFWLPVHLLEMPNQEEKILFNTGANASCPVSRLGDTNNAVHLLRSRWWLAMDSDPPAPCSLGHIPITANIALLAHRPQISFFFPGGVLQLPAAIFAL